MLTTKKISGIKILSFFIIFYFLNTISTMGTDGNNNAELKVIGLFQEAVNEANRHNYESAVKLLETIIEKDNNNLEAHNTLIEILINKGQLNEIKQKYERQFSENQQDFVNLYCLGLIAYFNKNFLQAEDYYNRALKLAPNIQFIYISLSSLELEEGNFTKAKEYLDIAADKDRNSYYIHLGLANFYFKAAMKEKSYTLSKEKSLLAIKEAKLALKMRPYHIEPYHIAGISYFLIPDFKNAETMLREALNIDSLNSTVNYSFAELMLLQEQYKNAKAYLLTAKDNQTEINKIWGSQGIINKYLNFLDVNDRINPIFISIIGFLILIFSITIHEYAHGWVANKFGDSTAKDAGRLSFNPLVHIDIVGTIVVPLILLISKTNFLIGWLKPVPENPQNFKRPKRDDILAALAGPLSNILLGIVFIILLTIGGFLLKIMAFKTLFFRNFFNDPIIMGNVGSTFWTYVIRVLRLGIIINFILAGFNLLPIPPLDGSHILMGIFPSRWLKKIYAPSFAFGSILILVLVVLRIINFLLYPVFLIIIEVFSLIGSSLGLN